MTKEDEFEWRAKILKVLEILDYKDIDATNKINGDSLQNSSTIVMFQIELILEEFKLVAEEYKLENWAKWKK